MHVESSKACEETAFTVFGGFGELCSLLWVQGCAVAVLLVEKLFGSV